MPRQPTPLPRMPTVQAPKKKPRRKRPSQTVSQSAIDKRSPKEKLLGSLGKSFATAAKASNNRWAQAALSGAAVGSEIEAAIRKYKRETAAKASSKAGGSTTQGTVSQSAASQKKKFHAKDLESTRKS